MRFPRQLLVTFGLVTVIMTILVDDLERGGDDLCRTGGSLPNTNKSTQSIQKEENIASRKLKPNPFNHATQTAHDGGIGQGSNEENAAPISQSEGHAGGFDSRKMTSEKLDPESLFRTQTPTHTNLNVMLHTYEAERPEKDLEQADPKRVKTSSMHPKNSLKTEQTHPEFNWRTTGLGIGMKTHFDILVDELNLIKNHTKLKLDGDMKEFNVKNKLDEIIKTVNLLIERKCTLDKLGDDSYPIPGQPDLNGSLTEMIWNKLEKTAATELVELLLHFENQNQTLWDKGLLRILNFLAEENLVECDFMRTLLNQTRVIHRHIKDYHMSLYNARHLYRTYRALKMQNPKRYLRTLINVAGLDIRKIETWEKHCSRLFPKGIEVNTGLSNYFPVLRLCWD